MAKLRTEHKRLIVQRLATFVSSAEIVAELRECGVEVSWSQVAYYKPSAVGNDLAEEWKALHAATREAFVRDTSTIAVTHRAFRLREIETLYRDAKEKGALSLAAQLLEQAAKEVGEVYTNQRVQSQPSRTLEVSIAESRPGRPTLGIYLPDNGRDRLFDDDDEVRPGRQERDHAPDDLI